MIAPRDLVVIASAGQPVADCEVCGSEIAAGHGLTVRSGDRTLRFSCLGCLARYRADPSQFFSGSVGACCHGEHSAISPASEWSCDRA
ncbi:MAG: hypothetical protein ACSLFN_00460 [Candidatus Limnocylindrales bacterium]